MDSRQFRIIAGLLGLIGAVLIGLLFVLLYRGDGDEPSAAATTSSTAPTTLAPTTPPPTTALAPPTTPAPTTTPAPPTSPATTVAPSTAPPPTPTTGPPPPPLVLQDDGIGEVPFGTDPDTTIAYAESVLGPAKSDTGWIGSFSKYGTCPGDGVRGVEWGGEDPGFGFVLLFTQSPTGHQPGGGPHLFGYYYFGDPAGLVTEGGITVGSALSDAQAAHPGSTVEEHPLAPGSGIWTVDDVFGDDVLLWGFADGTDPGDTLSSINGGVTCGE